MSGDCYSLALEMAKAQEQGQAQQLCSSDLQLHMVQVDSGFGFVPCSYIMDL